MTPSSSSEREVFFLAGPVGPLCAVYHRPREKNEPPAHAVLHVPAFAEEMNKCRRMVTLQSERLAHAGTGVLIVDLSGTGDSAGEFGEARWETWQADLRAAIDWLRERGAETVTLWGVRLGALLALELALRHSDVAGRLVLWQPVVDGRTMLTQFLRLRVAADLLAGGERRESVTSLRERLAGGEVLEIAGYELAPALAAALEGRSFEGLGAPAGIPVYWFEVVATAGRGLSPAARKLIEAWRAAGIFVSAATVAGEPFWTTQEITAAPELVDETSALWTQAAAPTA